MLCGTRRKSYRVIKMFFQLLYDVIKEWNHETAAIGYSIGVFACIVPCVNDNTRHRSFNTNTIAACRSMLVSSITNSSPLSLRFRQNCNVMTDTMEYAFIVSVQVYRVTARSWDKMSMTMLKAIRINEDVMVCIKPSAREVKVSVPLTTLFMCTRRNHRLKRRVNAWQQRGKKFRPFLLTVSNERHFNFCIEMIAFDFSISDSNIACLWRESEESGQFRHGIQ